MTISRSRRTTTVVALAVTSLGGGALVAGASLAAATTPTHTSLSIRAQHSHVVAGHVDHISGDLRAAGKPAAGQSVALEARPRGASHFSGAGTATTGAHGQVVFTVNPTKTTRYDLRFAGGNGDRPSHSGVVTVRVVGHPHRRLATALRIRLARSVIRYGGSDRVIGRLVHHHHGLKGRQIVLQSRQPGTTPWAAVAKRATGAFGEVRFPVSPTQTTRYRLVFRGGALLRPSHSAGRTIAVRPRRLTAKASPRSIDAGQSAMVSGTLRDKGVPTQGVTIDLRAKKAGSHGHFTTVDIATTDVNGMVSFTVTPAASTHYRLLDPATSTSHAIASRIVTVTVRKPSSLSIRGKQVGSREVISGDLRGGGHGLGDRKVTLQERPAGGTTWTPVRTKRTGRHGQVVFHVATPTASTDYQLVFAGGGQYDGSSSGIVTVTES